MWTGHRGDAYSTIGLFLMIKKTYFDKLEKVQKRATKMIPEF